MRRSCSITKEIPYSVEISIEEYKEEPTIDRISAVIYVARDSQKGILIGHQGSRLKKVGSEARADLEQFLGKRFSCSFSSKLTRTGATATVNSSVSATRSSSLACWVCSRFYSGLRSIVVI